MWFGLGYLIPHFLLKYEDEKSDLYYTEDNSFLLVPMESQDLKYKNDYDDNGYEVIDLGCGVSDYPKESNDNHSSHYRRSSLGKVKISYGNNSIHFCPRHLRSVSWPDPSVVKEVRHIPLIDERDKHILYYSAYDFHRFKQHARLAISRRKEVATTF